MPRPDSRSEKAVQAAIVSFARHLGYHVTDTSQPRASMVTLGLPDLLLMGHGHAAWVEVKARRGRLSPAQSAWHDAARAAGQTVLVARSASDLVEPLRALGAPIAPQPRGRRAPR